MCPRVPAPAADMNGHCHGAAWAWSTSGGSSLGERGQTAGVPGGAVGRGPWWEAERPVTPPENSDTLENRTRPWGENRCRQLARNQFTKSQNQRVEQPIRQIMECGVEVLFMRLFFLVWKLYLCTLHATSSRALPKPVGGGAHGREESGSREQLCLSESHTIPVPPVAAWLPAGLPVSSRLVGRPSAPASAKSVIRSPRCFIQELEGT